MGIEENQSFDTDKFFTLDSASLLHASALLAAEYTEILELGRDDVFIKIFPEFPRAERLYILRLIQFRWRTWSIVYRHYKRSLKEKENQRDEVAARAGQLM